MTISPGTLLYALFACVAFALAGSSLVHAISLRGPWGKRDRRIVATTALAIPSLFLGAALGGLPGFGPLVLLHALLPIVCLAAIYANLASLREQHFSVHVLGAVTALWNAVLFAIYSVRAAQVLFQVDLGDEFSSLLTCSALTQRSVGAADAELVPVWLPLPLLLPPLASPTRVALVYGSVAGFCASFWIGLHAIEFPTAIEITRTLRAQGPRVELGLQREARLGMTLGSARELPLPAEDGTLSFLGSPPGIEGRIARARELGLERLRITVALDAVLDAEHFARLQHAAETVRTADLELVVALLPPSAHSTPRPAAEQRERAQQAQWIISERLHPDLLVLFSQPLSDTSFSCYGSLPIERWVAWISNCARIVRDARPSQRCGIELTPQNPAGLLLYESLRGNDVDVQEILFALDARTTAMPSVQQMLLELEGWLVTRPTAKQLGLLALPPAPLGLGGMQAQVGYVRRVVAFAERQPKIRHVDLGPMWDGREGWNGYWDNRDVPRPALQELQSLVLQVFAAPR